MSLATKRRILTLERHTGRVTLPAFVFVDAGESISAALEPYRTAGLDPFCLAMPGALP